MLYATAREEFLSQVCKLVVNLRNLVNVEVKAPEKAGCVCRWLQQRTRMPPHVRTFRWFSRTSMGPSRKHADRRAMRSHLLLSPAFSTGRVMDANGRNRADPCKQFPMKSVAPVARRRLRKPMRTGCYALRAAVQQLIILVSRRFLQRHAFPSILINVHCNPRAEPVSPNLAPAGCPEL